MTYTSRSAKLHVIKKKLYLNRYLYLIFLLPALYYVIFRYGPMVGLIISFKDFSAGLGIIKSKWVGFENYSKFLQKPYFWMVFKNTILLNLFNLFWTFPAPIVLALLLNEVKNTRFKKTVQTITYLPYFVSTVIVCGMIINFLSADGLVNQILHSVGIEKKQFLMFPQYFRSIYILSNLWSGLGWGSIIYLAALSSVDATLYEAAVIDGAGRWRQFVHVTFPGITPTIAIMFILATGNIMNVSFEKILLLYTGSTYEVADVIATYVYRQGLLRADFSYATAVGVFQSVVAFIFLLSANTLSRKLTNESLF